MTYTPPTASDLKGRYPEFSNVPDTIVSGALEEAGLAVGASWPDTKRAIAHRLLAAHILAFEGEPQRSADIAAGRTPEVRTISSMSVGDTSWSYTNSRFGSGDYSALKSTRYGEQFIELRKSAFIGVYTT